jgi:hypothetical protein
MGRIVNRAGAVSIRPRDSLCRCDVLVMCMCKLDLECLCVAGNCSGLSSPTGMWIYVKHM